MRGMLNDIWTSFDNKHNHVFDEQAIQLETKEQDTLVLCCQLTKESLNLTLGKMASKTKEKLVSEKDGVLEIKRVYSFNTCFSINVSSSIHCKNVHLQSKLWASVRVPTMQSLKREMWGLLSYGLKSGNDE